MLTYLGGKLPSDLWARSPAALLDVELAHEKASSLGRLGRNLEGALQALADFDATLPRCPPSRPRSARSIGSRRRSWTRAVAAHRPARGLRSVRQSGGDRGLSGAGRSAARDGRDARVRRSALCVEEKRSIPEVAHVLAGEPACAPDEVRSGVSPRRAPDRRDRPLVVSRSLAAVPGGGRREVRTRTHRTILPPVRQAAQREI